MATNTIAAESRAIIQLILIRKTSGGLSPFVRCAETALSICLFPQVERSLLDIIWHFQRRQRNSRVFPGYSTVVLTFVVTHDVANPTHCVNETLFAF